MSWPLVKIKDVGRVFTGKTPSKATDEYFGGDIPFVTPAELDGDVYVCAAKQTLNELGAKQIKLLPKDSVMVCCIGSLGKIGIAGLELATNQQINSVVFDEAKVFSKYGFYALSLLRPILEKIAPSTTVPIVNKSNFESLEIPLPPLEEQKRIAAILDKVDAIRRKRQQAIKLADDFLRSVFLEMFGDPVTNPKGWDVKKLSDFTCITTGNTPSRAEPKYYGDYIEWIKSDNINTPSHFLTKATEYLSPDGYNISRTVPAGSTLVTCIAGSFDCIGNAAYTDREVAFNQQINALTPKDGINSWFLYALILLSKKAIQSASTNSMKGMLSKGRMEEIELIVPDCVYQEKFGQIFSRYLALTKSLETTLDFCGDLFNSSSKRAFQGNL